MKKSIFFYSLALAGIAFLLEWLEYRYLVRMLPTQAYIAAVALVFTALGVWVGNRLSGRGADPAEAFEKNVQALEHLGISGREYEVLELLAAGNSNKEIAAKLFVSPNTVKTHLSSLYGKLEVSRRTQAVQRARELRMIP